MKCDYCGVNLTHEKKNIGFIFTNKDKKIFLCRNCHDNKKKDEMPDGWKEVEVKRKTVITSNVLSIGVQE